MSATSVLPEEDVLSSLDFKPRCGITWVHAKDPSKDRECPADAEFFAVFIGSQETEDHGLACSDCVSEMRHKDRLLRAEPLK